MQTMKQAARWLAAVEIWPVGLCIGASVFMARLLPVALVVALVFWPVRWFATGTLSRSTPVDWAFGVMLLMVPVSLWASIQPERTLTISYRLLTGMALFYALLNWTTSRARLRLLLTGVVVVGLLLALVGPLTMVGGGRKLPFIPPEVYAYKQLVLPFRANANVLGGYLVLLWPVPLALLLSNWSGSRWYGRGFLLITTLSMGAMLVLTQSRSALFAAGVMVLAMIALRWRRGWMVALVLGASVVGIGGLLQLSGMVVLVSTDTLSLDVARRWEIWSRAWVIIWDFPFTGVGMGMYGYVSRMLYPFFVNQPYIPHAHNLILEIALDLGIPGLVAWLSILGFVLLSAWRMYRAGQNDGDGWMMGVGVGLFCSQIALVVHGLMDAVTWSYVEIAVVVWGLWGLTAAGGKLRMKGVHPNGRTGI